MIDNMQRLTNRPLYATALDSSLFVEAGGLSARILEATRQNFNVAVFGAPGSGKTSLLHQVEYSAREDRRIVFVDASVATDAATFLQLVRFRLGLAPSPAETMRTSFSSMFQSQPPRTELSNVMWVLEDLRSDARSSQEGKPVTLVVDDLDPKIAHTVFGRLRNEIWGLSYHWLVSGNEASRMRFLTPPADSFFDVVVTIEPMPIPLLASLLVERAEEKLSFEVAEELAELADGNPRRALSLARDAVLSGNGAEELVAAHSDVAARLQRLPAAARMLYGELETQGQATAADAALLDRLGWSRQRARRVFGELEEAGLVVSRDEKREMPGRPRRIYELARALGQPV